MWVLVWLFFFSSAVSEEAHAVLRGSSLGGVKLLKMEIAERDVDSVFFNAVDTKRHLWWCLILGSVVFFQVPVKHWILFLRAGRAREHVRGDCSTWCFV